MTAMVMDGSTLYGVNRGQQLFTIDTGTGAVTAGSTLSGSGLGTDVFTTGFAPIIPSTSGVPEPRMWGVAGAGLLLCLLARRRRGRADAEGLAHPEV